MRQLPQTAISSTPAMAIAAGAIGGSLDPGLDSAEATTDTPHHARAALTATTSADRPYTPKTLASWAIGSTSVWL